MKYMQVPENKTEMPVVWKAFVENEKIKFMQTYAGLTEESETILLSSV